VAALTQWPSQRIDMQAEAGGQKVWLSWLAQDPDDPVHYGSLVFTIWMSLMEVPDAQLNMTTTTCQWPGRGSDEADRHSPEDPATAGHLWLDNQPQLEFAVNSVTHNSPGQPPFLS
jgi:hypothetical protein